MLPIFGALMMPILGRINNKVRDLGAVVFAGSAVVSAAIADPCHQTECERLAVLWALCRSYVLPKVRPSGSRSRLLLSES